MGLVDDRILQKIRREIDDPEKNVKPKAILNFLVKKEQITKAQATKLLQELEQEAAAETPVAVQHDDLVEKASEEKSYDTDDLTNLNPQQDEVVEVRTEATRLDMQDDVVDLDDPVYSPDEVIEEIVEPVQVAAGPSTLPAYGDPLGGAAMMGDPLATGDPMGGSYADQEAGSGDKPSKSILEFAGKRDNRDQWATKWLYIGFGILGFLLIMGAVLFLAVGGQNIEKLQKVAEESFQKRAYMDSIAKHEKLLELSPRHENASKWKVRIVHSMLAAPWESKNYEEVLKVAAQHLPNVYEEDSFGDLRPDLGLMLPGSALEVTAIANSLSIGNTPAELEAQLAKAKDAKSICDDSRFLTGSIRKTESVARKLDEINDNVRRIQDAIRKETDLSTTSEQIAALTASGKTNEAFSAYNLLIRKYGDLGTRSELRELMKQVSVKEVELVKNAEVSITGTNEDLESLVESQVVVARREGTPISSLQGVVLPVLADGVLYGIDAGDGTVLWNRFLGYETSLEPQWADTENHDELIVCDQRFNQILKIGALDGKLIWRCDIGEEFNRPTITIGKIIVTTLSGKMIGLNTATGDSFASVQLPQEARVPATVSTRYPLIFQPGEYSNLYVLSLEDLSCREVVYLGHSPGSVSVSAYEWSGYVLVPINGADYCDLHVLKPSKEEGVDPGLGITRTQTILRVTTGHINTPLFRMGRRVLAVSDTGDLRLLEMNKIDNEDAPINPVSEQQFEVRKGDKHYVQAEGSRLWIAGKGIERYRLSAVNEFKRLPLADPGDFFLGPVERFDNTLIHVRRRARSAMTSISAVDAESMQETWRTDLGAPFAGAPKLVDGKIQVVSSQGDLFSVDDAAQRVGYIDRGVWSADVAENYQFNQSIQLANGSYVCVGPAGRRDIILIKPDGTSTLGRLPSRADTPACPIIGLGNSIVVASKKGQVVIVNPETGQFGTPFQPPKQPGEDSNWRTPTVVSDSEVVVGQKEGQLYLLGTDGKSFELKSEINTQSTLDSGLVSRAKVVYGALRTEDGAYMVAWNTDGGFAEAKRLELDANYVAGPWIAGESLLMTDDQGNLVAFPFDLSGVQWKLPLGSDALTGAPIASGQSLLLTMSSGVMKVLDAGTGEVSKEVDFSQPVMHEPLFTEDKVFIGGADGRLLVLPRSAF